MRPGETRKGWKLLYIADVSVAPASLKRGKLVGSFLKDKENGTILEMQSYPALDRESIYVTPAGVAKRASGIELKDTTRT